MSTLTNYVYNELLQKIYNEEFKNRQRLPSEAELADGYEVSRPVVRDALARLRKEGFIYSKRGAGSFLVELTHAELSRLTPVKNWLDLQHCFEFRTFLEGEIAYRAAQRCNTRDRINIQKTYDQNFNKSSKKGTSEMDLDLSFHLAIAEAAHNRFYYEALKTISIQILNGMSSISSYFQRNKTEHKRLKDTEHETVLEAILAGDAEKAKASMQLHILKARDWLTAPHKEK